jgi:hypothetical protein
MVSSAWQTLPAEHREHWDRLAKEDRERYEREKMTYQGPWKVVQEKAVNGPKRPVSAFLAYSNERRKTVARANQHLSNGKVSGMLAAMWKQEPFEVRHVYEGRQFIKLEEFRRDRDEWLERTKQEEIQKYGGGKSSVTVAGERSDPAIPSSGITVMSNVARSPSDEGSNSSAELVRCIEQLGSVDAWDAYKNGLSNGPDISLKLWFHNGRIEPLIETDDGGFLAAAAALFEPLG